MKDIIIRPEVGYKDNGMDVRCNQLSSLKDRLKTVTHSNNCMTMNNEPRLTHQLHCCDRRQRLWYWPTRICGTVSAWNSAKKLAPISKPCLRLKVTNCTGLGYMLVRNIRPRIAHARWTGARPRDPLSSMTSLPVTSRTDKMAGSVRWRRRAATWTWCTW